MALPGRRAVSTLLLLTAIAVELSIAVGSLDGGRINIDPSTRRFVDGNGRERVFHGTNVVYKAPPYYPAAGGDWQHSYGEEDVQLLQAWGINSVRLGVMWPGAMPERGVFNDTYFEALANITALNARYGIRTLLDMHQDSFSRKFCGEGVPDWATVPAAWLPAFPEPLARPYAIDNATGEPTPADCAKISNWADYQGSFALATAAHNLYTNHDGLLDQWAAFWARVASVWVDDDFVLGYELMNEPWAGNVFADPELLIPGVADRKMLEPVWEVLHNAIRSIDDEHIVFFEGVTWDNVVVGFQRSPGGADYLNRTVLAYHLYNPPVLSYQVAIENYKLASERLGCGWFCSETGFGTSEGEDLRDVLDRNVQGWMNWEYKGFVPMTGYDFGCFFSNNSVDYSCVSSLARTYAPAVAGHILWMHYNASTHEFAMAYHANTRVRLPTEIYFHEALHYPAGFQLTASPADSVLWTHRPPNQIWLQHANSTVDGTLITLQLTALPVKQQQQQEQEPLTAQFELV